MRGLFSWPYDDWILNWVSRFIHLPYLVFIIEIDITFSLISLYIYAFQVILTWQTPSSIPKFVKWSEEDNVLVSECKLVPSGLSHQDLTPCILHEKDLLTRRFGYVFNNLKNCLLEFICFFFNKRDIIYIAKHVQRLLRSVQAWIYMLT